MQIHLVAEEGALTVLLRVPLEAMRDVEIATRGPGYLVLEGITVQLEDAARLWLAQDLHLYADARALPAPELLAARVALPTDTAFAGFETARRAIRRARLPPGTDLYWQQAMLEVEFRYPRVSARAGLEIDPAFARLGLRTVTEVRFLAADGTSRSFAFVGNPGRVKLMPGWVFVFGNFLGEGFRHVLGGSDHLLFLLVLVLPLRRLRPLVRPPADPGGDRYLRAPASPWRITRSPGEVRRTCSMRSCRWPASSVAAVRPRPSTRYGKSMFMSRPPWVAR